MNAPLFATTRKKVLQLYEGAGQPFVASTLPYHSTQLLVADVVDDGNDVAYAVFARNQVLDFFSYGVGDQFAGARATELHTNLGKGKSTNGASDFIIEGIGFSCQAYYVGYAEDTFTLVDPVTSLMEQGQVPFYDPAAIFAPPQVQSPFNNENGIFQSLLPLMSLELEWDRKRTEKLGLVDLLPQAGAASYMRANGVPHSENRYRIPEGYLWRRDGEPDSELIARVRLQSDLVVPLDLVTPPGAAEVAVPDNINMTIVMRLFGLEVNLPSAN